jgi:hypothetical protein
MPRYNGPAQLVQGSNVVDVSCAFDVVREEPSGLRT